MSPIHPAYKQEGCANFYNNDKHQVRDYHPISHEKEDPQDKGLHTEDPEEDLPTADQEEDIHHQDLCHRHHKDKTYTEGEIITSYKVSPH